MWKTPIATLLVLVFVGLAVVALMSYWLASPNLPKDTKAQFLIDTQAALLASEPPDQNTRVPVKRPQPKNKPLPGAKANNAVNVSANLDRDKQLNGLRSSLSKMMDQRKNPLDPGVIQQNLESQLPEEVIADLERMRLISSDGQLDVTFRGPARLSGFKGRFRLPPGGSDKAKVAQVVNDFPAVFGIDDRTELIIEPLCKGSACTYKVERYVGDLPVWGGDFTVTVSDEEMISARGLFPVRSVLLHDAEALSRDQILGIVTEHFGKTMSDISGNPTIEEGIRIVRPMVLHALRVEVQFGWFEKYSAFISVESGRVVDTQSRVQTGFKDASGTDLKGITRQFRAEETFDGFRLKDDQAPAGGESSILTGLDFTERSDGRYIKNPESAADYSSSSFADGQWDPAAVSAITGVRKTMEYFKDVHGRTGLRGDGRGVKTYINVTLDGGALDNALWDGESIFFGVGGGSYNWNNAAIASDVAAHEFTHGVITSTSALEYSFESGALNESYSDFFGVLVDGENDWDIGEDLYAGVGLLRSMSKPSRAGDPAHMDDYKNWPYSRDSGGVHTNSGIPNRALYLLAEGLTAENLGQSIGRERAAKIIYQTMITLPSQATFSEAAAATLEQAGLQYGPSEEQAVTKAFSEVGISTSIAPISVPSTPGFESLNAVLAVYPSDNGNLLIMQLYDNDFAGFNASLFVQINSYSSAMKRPSIATDALSNAAGIYFTEANDIIYSDTRSSEERVVVEKSTYQSISFAQGLEKFAATLETGNTIGVCSFVTDSCQEFQVFGPDFTSEGRSGTPAELIDAMDWDPTGRLLAFDYAVCIGLPGDNCAYYQWSIGVLNTSDGSISYPFANQPVEYDVGFPTFSNLTDRYIAFDLARYFDDADNGVGNSAVFILDRAEMDLEFGALPDAGQYSGPNGPVFAKPSFTSDDTGLAYLYYPENNMPQIVLAGLENYSGLDKPQYFMDPYVADFPVSVPGYHRPPSLNLSATPNQIDFGEVERDAQFSKELCINNEGSFRITVSPSESSSDAVSSTLRGAVLRGGQKTCGSVVVDTSKLSPGMQFSAQLRIPSDGSPLQIDVIGSLAEVTDTDGDGIEDEKDAFPNDSSESVDTDSDGIGNNADTDDDNDGMPDSFETANGLNPLYNGDASLDADGDGISNLEEYLAGTDPQVSDLFNNLLDTVQKVRRGQGFLGAP